MASSARGRQETSDNPDDSRSRARPQRLRIDDTLDRILDPEPDTQATRLRDRLEHELHECDKQIAKCRALLDDDVDLATVSGWLKEANSTLADRDIVREALTEIGALTGFVASSDPAERARFYDAVGVSGTYRSTA